MRQLNIKLVLEHQMSLFSIYEMIALVLFLLGLASCSNVQNTIHVDDTVLGCTDENDEISCCIGETEILGWINLVGCADMIIDWDNLNIILQLELNGTILFETTFGFNNPPEICADIWGLHICLKLEDMEFDDWNLSGCLDLIIDDSIDVPMGCFDTSKIEA